MSATNMSAWWGRAPDGVAQGPRTGLEAALWRVAGRSTELKAKPDPQTHIVCPLLAGAAQETMLLDGRIAHHRRIHAGDFTHVPAGADPAALLEESSLQFLHIYLPHSLLQDAAAEEGWQGAVELLLPDFGRDHALTAIGLRMAAELGREGRAAQLLMDGLALQLSAHLLQSWSNAVLSAAEQRLPVSQLRRAMQYLQDHLGEDVSLEAVAAAAGLAPRHFARAFRRASGTTPHGWLQMQRVARAKILLRHGRHSLEEVARQCGFHDTRYFSQVFTRVAGVNPQIWRRSLRG